MTRVIMVPLGRTGYIGEDDLYSFLPGRIPLIMKSVCTTPGEVLGRPLEVYNNPKTHEFEVKVPAGVRARYHPGASISADGFFRVVMVLPDGRKVQHERIPDGYWQRWDGTH